MQLPVAKSHPIDIVILDPCAHADEDPVVIPGFGVAGFRIAIPLIESLLDCGGELAVRLKRPVINLERDDVAILAAAVDADDQLIALAADEPLDHFAGLAEGLHLT